MAGNSAEPGRSVVSKIASILMQFTDSQVLTLTEIAHQTGLPVSTAHRLVTELTERRLLARTEGGAYQAGLALRIIRGSAGDEPDVGSRARQVLEDLATVTQCRVRLGVLAGHEIAFMEKRPHAAVVSAFTSDAVLPTLSSALGCALLAFSCDEVVTKVINSVLCASPRTCTGSRDVFTAMLAEVRRAGMAIKPGGPDSGSCCFAMPVFGPGGEIGASLGLTVDDTSTTLRPLMGALTIAARSLSRDLA